MAGLLRRARGFTLIELLVVIAIMGILAALIIVSLQGSQKKASDADRKTKAKSLATALEQRFVETGNYSFSVDTGAAGGMDIQEFGTVLCAGVIKTDLVKSGSNRKYLESDSACTDKDANITHRYKSLEQLQGGGGKQFVIVWQLKTQTEKILNPFPDHGVGNGIYKSLTLPNPCASTEDFVGGTGYITGQDKRPTITCLVPNTETNYFVVYGPQ